MDEISLRSKAAFLVRLSLESKRLELSPMIPDKMESVCTRRDEFSTRKKSDSTLTIFKRLPFRIR